MAGWGVGKPLALALCLLLAHNAGAAPAPIQAEIVSRSPRDFGLMLGDVISQQVRVTLPAGQQLNPHTLPTPGRVNNWLELLSFRHTATGSTHEFTLTYQLFKQASQTQPLLIPATTLLLDNGETRVLPPWPISYAPLLPEGDADALPLRPPSPPALRATQSFRPQWQALLGAFALCLLGWLWASDRLPFLRKRPNAFTQATRTIRRLAKQPQPSAAHVWQCFQQALADSAGQAVFPDQLNDYFAGQPGYLPLQDSTRQLVGQAHRARFAQQQGDATPAYPAIADTLQLCQQFSEREQAQWTR